MLENISLPRGEKLAEYASRLETIPKDGAPAWLEELRYSAADAIRTSGFPHAKLESWEFSQVRKVLADTYEGPAEVSRDKVRERLSNPLAKTGVPSFVLINGVLEPGLSDSATLPKGLRLIPASELGQYPDLHKWISSLYATGSAEQSFTGLNLVLGKSPMVLYAEPGLKLEQEVQVLSFSSGGIGHRAIVSPGLFVFAGEGSSISVHEIHTGLDQGRYLSNACTALALASGSSVNHVKVIAEGTESYHLGGVKAALEGESSLKTHTIMSSGSILRNEVETDLNGEGAKAELFGLYLAEGRQQMENSTCINHNKPECVSREHYKGILNDQARALFRGRIVVAEDAQKTDSEQTNNNLLLSADARINTKPQLEIYADDVSCTHGATVGQLEDEKIFYLQSRGISRSQAGALLVRAFGNEIIAKIDSDKLRDVLEEGLLSTVAGK